MGRSAIAAFNILSLAFVLAGSPAWANDPLGAVRAFCRADGRGARLRPRTWTAVAPYVTWTLEPAWDQLHLITGYEVATPRQEDEELVTVEVRYTVSAVVLAGNVDRRARVETRELRLAPGAPDGRWRIIGPPPAPFVFASEADADALASLLVPENGQYLSASELAWRGLRDAGWDVPYLSVASLGSASWLAGVSDVQPGDLILYFDGERAYHVGRMVDAEQVVSATLNAGVVQAPRDAFSGRVEYRRPAMATAGPDDDEATPAAYPTPATSGSPPAPATRS